MRLLFTADSTVSSSGWVQAIDNVELGFSFRGDFDGDNVLTASDIDLLTSAMRSNPVLEFDLNADGNVDFDDLDFWVTDLYGTKFGDTDLNFSVNFADFLLFSRNFGTATAQWESGDFDGDAEIGFSDFLLFSRNFSGISVAAATVPEPNANAAFVCVVGLCLLGRSRRTGRTSS
jgi:hypothetical protein